LSAAFLAGAPDIDESVDRASRLLGKRWRWLRPLARRVFNAFATGARPQQFVVTNCILADSGFLLAYEKDDPRVVQRLAAPPGMNSVAAAAMWHMPVINTPAELADWLGIETRELDWFADLKNLEYKANQGRLRHYHYRPLAKRFGHIRLIEAPKPRLKEIQRRILAEILEQIPPHCAAHGFRRGRSIKSFAAGHVGQQVVLKIDLRDFFPSIGAARVKALLRTVGYSEHVADLLAGLCTNATPLEVWEGIATEADCGQPVMPSRLYARPHLPQGAPTSPALANLCAYRLDCRLFGLATSAGAAYTRYADDLAFSGGCDFERVVKRFQLHACAIAFEEGFSVRHRKTRIMPRGVRQRLAGMVVNDHLNVPRADYERLKATLTNFVRFGTPSQNREGHDNFRAHLLGELSFVEMINPIRGQKLRRLFEQIA